MKYLTFLLFALLLAACGTQTADGTGLVFRTADPRLSVGVRLLQPPVPPIEPSLLPTVTPTPCDAVVKGNVSSSGEKIAHSPGQANYDTVAIDESKGERLFCTIEEAISEGWRAAQR